MPRPSRLLRPPVLALAAAGAAACATSPARTTDSATGEVVGAAAADAVPAIVFANQSLHQADVYAVTRSGARVRLGTVQSGRTDTLSLRSASLPAGGTFVIAANLLAVRGTPTTGELSLSPGEWLSVTLPSSANTLNVLPVPR